MIKSLAIPFLVAAAAAQLTGCSSVLLEGGSAGAGILSGSIAGALTNDAATATGIGIGVQAATRAGIQYGQRRIHGEAQQQIAEAAGPLAVGQVRPWVTRLSVPLEAEEEGRVTVSRVIGTGELQCKEIVVSLEKSARKPLPVSELYVASICRGGNQWAWASAEPATARWGALQ